jgi:DNA-binding transcriptional regulator YhcF (GntR family)
MTYVDPRSDLVKAVLVKKATQLATEGLELLLDEAEAQGLSRDEALAIVDRTIGELRERDESDQVFQRLARP